MDAVSSAVQELLSLREKIEQQLQDCLKKLENQRQDEQDSVQLSSVRTPSLEQQIKRRRIELDPEDSTNQTSTSHDIFPDIKTDIPCRLDLSSFACFFHEGCSQIVKNVEQRAGKKQRPRFVYGNYPYYYSYRLNESSQDPRLQCFSKDWFHKKRCLDVGSHIGTLPFSLVVAYTPQSMLGVEIDPDLVYKAESKRSHLSCEHKGNKSVLKSLNRTQFVKDDIMSFLEKDAGVYDVITCLSVSKWIHFHHGDEGMKSLFHRFWNALAKNGKLIFEPQPYRSYSQAVRKQDMSEVPYHVSQLNFTPDQFLDYLMNEIGFSMSDTMMVLDSSKGFDRPIYVLTKTENQMEQQQFIDCNR